MLHASSLTHVMPAGAGAEEGTHGHMPDGVDIQSALSRLETWLERLEQGEAPVFAALTAQLNRIEERLADNGRRRSEEAPARVSAYNAGEMEMLVNSVQLVPQRAVGPASPLPVLPPMEGTLAEPSMHSRKESVGKADAGAGKPGATAANLARVRWHHFARGRVPSLTACFDPYSSWSRPLATPSSA
jgi:hypothetical protein